MHCCCNKPCLTLWSRLPWKPTGQLWCSTRLGKHQPASVLFLIKTWTLIAHFIYANISLSLSVCYTSLYPVSFSLSLFQHGWQGRDGVPGDPFRPDEIPEIHWYWETNCQVSKKNTFIFYIENHRTVGHLGSSPGAPVPWPSTKPESLAAAEVSFTAGCPLLHAHPSLPLSCSY